MTCEHDRQFVDRRTGEVTVHFGPRKEDGDNRIPCAPEEADCWTVYVHEDGQILETGDAATEKTAIEIGKHFAGYWSDLANPSTHR